MMQDILILGGGQLGTALAHRALDKGMNPTIYTATKADIKDGIERVRGDYRELDKLFGRLDPEMCIHTTAITSVDYCEEHPHEAKKVNVGTVERALGPCIDMGIKLVFVSTDYVFSGEKGDYSEDDPASPINHYGRTKLEAERTISSSCSAHLIIRPGLIYSPYRSGGNFVLKLREIMEGQGEFFGATDWYCTPFYAPHLAACILDLAGRGATGIYHCAHEGKISRYKFALELVPILGYRSENVHTIERKDIPLKAPRPRDTSLNTEKISQEIGPLPSMEEALDDLRKRWKQ